MISKKFYSKKPFKNDPSIITILLHELVLRLPIPFRLAPGILPCDKLLFCVCSIRSTCFVIIGNCAMYVLLCKLMLWHSLMIKLQQIIFELANSKLLENYNRGQLKYIRNIEYKFNHKNYRVDPVFSWKLYSIFLSLSNHSRMEKRKIIAQISTKVQHFETSLSLRTVFFSFKQYNLCCFVSSYFDTKFV